MRRLEQACLILVLLCIFIPLRTPFGWVSLALYMIPLAALLIFWLLRSLLQRGTAFTRWDYAASALAAGILMTTLLKAPHAFGGAFIFASGCLLGLYARHSFGVVFTSRILMNMAMIILGVEVFFAIIQFVTQSDMGNVMLYFGEVADAEAQVMKGDMQRASGTIGQSNAMALTLAMLMPFARHATQTQGGRASGYQTYIADTLWVLALGVLIVGNHRGCLCAVVLSVVMHAKVSASESRRRARGGVRRNSALLSGGIAFISLLLAWQFIGLDSSTFVENSTERLQQTRDSLAERIDQQRVAILTLARSPITGIGWEEGKHIWDEHPSCLPPWWAFRPHNQLVIVGLGGGIPALLLLLLVIVPVGNKYLKRRKRLVLVQSRIADPLAISISVFLFGSMLYVVTVNHVVWPLFMFFLGCLRNEVDSAPLRVSPQVRVRA